MRRHSIRKVFNWIMVLFSLFFISVIVFFYQLYTAATRQNAQVFYNAFTAQSVQLMNQYTVETEALANRLLFHPDVTAFFLQKDDTKVIYENHVRVGNLITEQLPFTEYVSAVIFFTPDGSFYRHMKVFSNEECRTVAQAMDLTRRDKRIVELGDRGYLCAVEPVYDLRTIKATRLTLDEPIGSIVILSNLNNARKLLKRYEGMDSFFIALVDETDTVLLCNRTEWEGLSMERVPLEALFTVREHIQGSSISMVASLTDYAPLGGGRMRVYLPLLFAVLVGLLLLLARTIRSVILLPMERLRANIQSMPLGGGAHRLPRVHNRDMDTVVESFNRLLARLDETHRSILDTQRQLYDARGQEAQSRLHLLKKQINIHFLFNALSSIQTLLYQNETDKAAKVSQGLAALMHYSYDDERYIGVFDEMETISRYIDVMNIRFGGKFAATLDIDDNLEEYVILRLLIQPLVENAIAHGLQGKQGDGRLLVVGRLSEDGGCVTFVIADDGVGMPRETLEAIRRDLESIEYRNWGLGGIALNNISRRIKLTYGDTWGLEIESEEGRGTRVTVALPAQRQPPEDA